MLSPILSLYVSWALTAFWPITGRRSTELMDPVLFSLCNLLVGGVALAPWLLANGRWRRLVEPGLRLNFAVLGGLGSGMTSVLLTVGVSLTTAANAAIMCQVEVLYSVILSALMLGERVSLRQGAASTLVVLGTALILGKDLGTPHWKGDLLILATPWMFQLSHVFTKRLPADVEVVTIAAARTLYGAAVLVPLAAWKLATGEPRFEFGAESAALIAFHGAILSAATVVLFYRAIRNLELAKTTAIMLSYPALTLVYCAVLGIEPIGWHQVAGLLLSLGGAVWITYQMRGPTPAKEAAPAPASAPTRAGLQPG